mgnify:CR=1 FL=1
MIRSQSFELKDRVVVITGGAGLLGKKYAEAIAEFGGIPILLDINQKDGIEKSKIISKEYNVNCKFFQCDITDENSITIPPYLNNASIPFHVKIHLHAFLVVYAQQFLHPFY